MLTEAPRPSAAANGPWASRVRGPGRLGQAATPSIAATAWISRVVEARKASFAALQVGDRPGPLLDVEDALISRSRVIDSSTPAVERGGPQGAASANPEDRWRSAARARPVWPHQHRLVGALGFCQPGRLHVGGVGERLDSVEDRRSAVGDGGELDGLGVWGKRLGGGDPATAAGDDQPQLAVPVAELHEQCFDLGAQRQRGRTRARSPPRSAASRSRWSPSAKGRPA